MAPASDEEPPTAKKQLPIEPIPIKPPETFKRTDEPIQPSYVQSKPRSHSPKISPSSIPNPNPSIISTKQTESGYPAVGGYPFSIPGYSAFQPVTHPTVTQSSSSSIQPTVSSNIVKSQSDYAPYTNISGDALTASVPVSSKSSTQGATLSSLEILSSVAITSTCSSAAPITTAASMGSMPQTTPALTIPPISTIVSEPSLTSSMSQFQSLESTQVMTLEQPSPAIARISLGNPMSSMVPGPPIIISEVSKDGTPSSMPTTPSKSIQRTQSDHCQIPADMLIQRGTQEHAVRPSSTLSSDSLNKQLPLTTPLTLSSSQATTSSITVMQHIPVEHSIQPNTTQELSIRRDMLPTPTLSSESPHRLPLDHSLPTIPLEASIQRMTPTIPNMLSETLRQQTSMGHSVPLLPNMPPESSMQRMPLEYYMPSMPLIPPELVMRRMQLLQYMQSLQNMAPEPSIALMPHGPPYAMSLLQGQSTTTIQATSLEKSLSTTSMVSSELIVSHRQPVPSTPTIPSQPTTPMQVMSEEQSTSLVPVKCEPAQELMIPRSLEAPPSSVSSQAHSLPLESVQKVPALSSEQSVTSNVQTQQMPMSITKADPPLSSLQLLPSISRIDQLKPPMLSVQSMPLLTAMVSDRSIMTPQMQKIQSVSLSSDMPPEIFAPITLNKSSIISSEPVMHGQQSILTAPPMCTNTSELAVTSVTQMPLVQSMPYDSAKLINASMQQTVLEKSNETISVASRPSVGIVPATNTLINTISNFEFAHSLQSMSVPQSSMSTTSSNSMQLYMQTSMPSDSSIHRMHVIHPLQSNSMDSDKFVLYTQTSTPLELPMLQTSLINSTQPSPLTPSKFSTESISCGPNSNVRPNLAPPLPSISSTSSSIPSLVSISHIPIPQSTPQLSISTMTSNSSESMQRIQLQHIPFMSIVPSQSNPIKTKEMIPPLSLVQSMSSMTLAPTTTSLQPISFVDSMPQVSDSLQMMSSGQFSDTKLSEMPATYTLPVSTAASLHSREKDKQNEILPDLHDNCPNTSQIQKNKNVEDHFAQEIKTAAVSSEDVEPIIGSLTQKTKDSIVNGPLQMIPKEIKRKPLERFSLKTSIPISKIDIKSVPNPPDIAFQNPLVKKLGYNALKVNSGPRVEKQMHRHLLIRGAGMESEEYRVMRQSTHSNLNTLKSAKERVNASDTQSRKLESNIETKETNLTASSLNKTSTRTIVPKKDEINKLGIKANSSDMTINDQNNQIVFIQNKNCTNKKMILTIQQQNPQVILKRKNIENSPLRFSSPFKKCKEESVTITEHIPSKVVALKRLHQGNCDEDDFENLITENQIYGNKIVVKEKMQGTSQEQNLKLKNNKTNRLSQSETKNVVKPPNFVYLSNVKYPTNIMMYKNNVKTNIGSNKDCKVAQNENKVTEVNSTLNKSNDSTIKPINLQNVPISKENQTMNAINNNLLQITSNKTIKTDTVMSKTNQNVLISPKVLQTVQTNTVDINNEVSEPTAKPIEQTYNKVVQPVEQSKIIHKVVSNTCHGMESNLHPKTPETIITTTQTEEEVSSLDIYEKRKRLRRVKYLLNRGVKDIQKSETKKPPSNGRYIITPEKIKAEIYKEFASTRIVMGDEGGDMDSEYEDETKEYESIIKTFSPPPKEDCGKKEFLLNFMLGTPETCNEILWNKRERMLHRDKIASAYIAAGRLDCLLEDDTPKDIVSTPNTINSMSVTQADFNTKGSFFQLKQMFLSHLQLKYVKPQHKASYEITWREILKERKRRDTPDQSSHVFKQPRPQLEKVEINTNSELKILTEIKNSVTENNNLIKKRLDLSCQDEGDSIKILAEKNFSELDRLSKMADRSVKHFSGQDTRKRDLNPGFDSANIQNITPKLDPPINFPNINIPSISKIISLKTTSEPYAATSTQATSMDEPQNSAAGVDEMFSEANIDKIKEIGCQTENSAWPGVEEMIKMYRDFEKARKREVIELTRRNTALKVEGAHITRNASRHSDRARALLAERRNLSIEEGAMKQAIQRLFNAVDIVRNYF